MHCPDAQTPGTPQTTYMSNTTESTTIASRKRAREESKRVRISDTSFERSFERYDFIGYVSDSMAAQRKPGHVYNEEKDQWELKDPQSTPPRLSFPTQESDDDWESTPAEEPKAFSTKTLDGPSLDTIALHTIFMKILKERTMKKVDLLKIIDDTNISECATPPNEREAAIAEFRAKVNQRATKVITLFENNGKASLFPSTTRVNALTVNALRFVQRSTAL